MSRSLVIGAVVLILLGGGAAAYVLTKEDDKNKESASQTSPSPNNNAFNPASTENLEFAATITAEGAPQAIMERDDKGNTRYVTSQSGQQMEIIYTSDAYYSCQGDTCMKFSISQSGSSGFDPSAYTYDEAKLAGYGSPAYKGKQSCPSGTCDVWEVSTGGVTSTLHVDSSTKRISQVEGTVGGRTSKIVYEYKDVTISVPQNAQTVTVPGQ